MAIDAGPSGGLVVVAAAALLGLPGTPPRLVGPGGRLVVVAAAVCLAMLAAQLWLIGRVELTFDEAYYTLWSRNLAWGYLDHPPMIAAWIRASTFLFGPTEFGVRALNTLVVGALPALIAAI